MAADGGQSTQNGESRTHILNYRHKTGREKVAERALRKWNGAFIVRLPLCYALPLTKMPHPTFTNATNWPPRFQTPEPLRGIFHSNHCTMRLWWVQGYLEGQHLGCSNLDGTSPSWLAIYDMLFSRQDLSHVTKLPSNLLCIWGCTWTSNPPALPAKCWGCRCVLHYVQFVRCGD